MNSTLANALLTCVARNQTQNSVPLSHKFQLLMVYGKWYEKIKIELIKLDFVTEKNLQDIYQTIISVTLTEKKTIFLSYYQNT